MKINNRPLTFSESTAVARGENSSSSGETGAHRARAAAVRQTARDGRAAEAEDGGSDAGEEAQPGTQGNPYHHIKQLFPFYNHRSCLFSLSLSLSSYSIRLLYHFYDSLICLVSLFVFLCFFGGEGTTTLARGMPREFHFLIVFDVVVTCPSY